MLNGWLEECISIEISAEDTCEGMAFLGQEMEEGCVFSSFQVGKRNEKKGGCKSYYSKKRVSLYKTEICKSFETSSMCKYGSKCQFAHSLEELRGVERHPRYKTELCKTYWEKGECPYGKRCCFLHSEVAELAEKEREKSDCPEEKKANETRGSEEDQENGDLMDFDVEMSQIQTDAEMRKEEPSLESFEITEEDMFKLSLLGRYKTNRAYRKKEPRSLSCFNRALHMYKNNSSVWVPADRCFIFVGAGEKVCSLRGVGVAPGEVYLRI